MKESLGPKEVQFWALIIMALLLIGKALFLLGELFGKK